MGGRSIDVYPVRHLRDAISFLTGEQRFQPHKVDISDLIQIERNKVEDFADVKGQESAKRVIEASGYQCPELCSPDVLIGGNDE